jgi:hypothetical protein
MSAAAPVTGIEELGPGHWPAVARIYGEGIATGNATFETELPSWEVWDRSHLAAHRFVGSLDGEEVGWVAVSLRIPSHSVHPFRSNPYTDSDVFVHPVRRLS